MSNHHVEWSHDDEGCVRLRCPCGWRSRPLPPDLANDVAQEHLRGRVEPQKDSDRPETIIARALPALYDDAFNPARAIATEPVDTRVDDRWRDQPNAAHPHLRHPTGAGQLGTPTGDRDTTRLYRRAAQVIGTCYRALVPNARPRGAAPTPAPAELVSQLAVIHRHTTTSGGDTDRAVHIRNLTRLAADLEDWARPARVLPADQRDQCWNPRRRGHRCKGYPVVAQGLCNPCYQHERRQKDSKGDDYRLPPRPGTVAEGDEWKATHGHGQPNDSRVTSEPKVPRSGRAYAQAPQPPKGPRTRAGITGGFRTCQACGGRHELDQGCAV